MDGCFGGGAEPEPDILYVREEAGSWFREKRPKLVCQSPAPSQTCQTEIVRLRQAPTGKAPHLDRRNSHTSDYLK